MFLVVFVVFDSFVIFVLFDCLYVLNCFCSWCVLYWFCLICLVSDVICCLSEVMWFDRLVIVLVEFGLVLMFVCGVVILGCNSWLVLFGNILCCIVCILFLSLLMWFLMFDCVCVVVGISRVVVDMFRIMDLCMGYIFWCFG